MGERSVSDLELAAFRASRDLLRALSATFDISAASEAILDAACHVEGIDCGGVYIVDQHTGALRLTAHRGLPPAFLAQTTSYTREAPEAGLVRAGRPLYLGEVELAALEDVPSARVCITAGLRALAVLPVQLEGRAVAVLNLGSRTQCEIPLAARDALEVMTAPLGGAVARAQMEARLRQASIVVESSPVVLFRWKADAGWPVDYVSDNVIQFGYSPQELLTGDTAYAALLYAEDHDRVVREVEAYSAAGVDHFQQEYRIRTKDGRVRWVDDRTAIERDAEGRITHYQGTVIDVTDRKEANAALLKRTQQLEALRAISSETTHELDLTRLLGLIHQRAATLLGATAGFLSLYDETTQTLTPRSWQGHGDWVASLSFRLGQGISGKVAAQRRGMVVNEYRTSPYAIPLILDNTTVTSVVAEPLIYRDRLVGVLTVDNHGAEERTFSEEDRELLTLFASQAAIAIENARLYEAAQQDLGERKKAEQALRAHQDRLETLLHSSLELARIQPREQLVGGLGAACARMLNADGGDVRILEGSDLVKIVGWGDYEAVGSLQRLPMGEGLSGVMAVQGEPLIVDNLPEDPRLTPRARDAFRDLGHRSWFGVPIKLGDQLLGTLNMWSRKSFSPEDIAIATAFAAQAAIALENARLYAELRDSFERLQHAQAALVQGEKLRALGQLAAGIAHDLNNMLAAILGQAELIRLHTLDPVVHAALELLYTAASDGVQVVRRLQGFGRQKAEGPLVLCDPVLLVQEALELTQPRWKDEAQRENRLIQVWTALDNLPPVLGEPSEIREVLTNLIFNAVDAMPTGGSLTVAGYTDLPAGATGKPTEVVLTVTDTGTGMSGEVRRQVFDPFFTTKGYKGMGLGLAMAYGIMKRHGGSIDVISAPGEGTTFTLRFPVAPPGAPAAPEQTQPVAVTAARLLVIDDEALVRNAISSMLRAAGHEVIEAESGNEGLALLADARVDLVLTDLGMPNMTGWEVARRVKAMRPELPVILLTGWGQYFPEQTRAGACVDQVLAKPVRLDDLQRIIARCAARSDPQ